MTVSITTTPLVDHAAYVQMCECGQGPRIGGKQSGCKRCERIDRYRLGFDRPTELVRMALSRFDEHLSAAEIADVTGLTIMGVRHALHWLIKQGEARIRGWGPGAEYRRAA